MGHAAIYNGSPFPCIYPDLMMRLEINESVADKHFTHRWLTYILVREYIKNQAKGTSVTMKKYLKTLQTQLYSDSKAFFFVNDG